MFNCEISIKRLRTAQTAANSSSNDAPFIIENSCGRSMLLLANNMSFDSSQKHCVATAHVSGKLLNILGEIIWKLQHGKAQPTE